MYNKRINIWKSVSILILIKKDIWAFSSYSHSLKTANLKHTRISRWKFTLYRAWTIHAYLCARCLAVPQTENRLWMVPPFFIALWYTSENLSKRNFTAKNAPLPGSPINFIATEPIHIKFSNDKVQTPNCFYEFLKSYTLTFLNIIRENAKTVKNNQHLCSILGYGNNNYFTQERHTFAPKS